MLNFLLYNIVKYILPKIKKAMGFSDPFCNPKFFLEITPLHLFQDGRRKDH
jgi:hypothetical protein